MEEDIKLSIANNLIKYRKKNNLTQGELAEKINYSDKAVSKWERGESIPDILVLKQIANTLNISLNDLLEKSESDVDIKFDDKKSKLKVTQKILITVLSYVLVWFIITCTFVALRIFTPIEKVWLLFIYAIPLSSIILIVFSCLWSNGLFQALSVSVFIWTTALSLCLTFTFFQNIWLLFIICVPLQLLTIFWFAFRKTLAPKLKNTFKRKK